MPRPKDICTLKITNKCINKLKRLYDTIPNTKGCMENLDKCNAWCCLIQTPSLFFVEFMNVWSTVLKEFSTDDIVELVKRAIESYIFFRPDIGCIFFNPENKHCTCHSTRPYNCRIYGITPKEEFEPRYQAFKKLHTDNFYDIRDQCDLVFTSNNEKVTTKKTDKWWDKLCDIENYYGVPKNYLNDGPEGTYRNFHDHLLLHLFPNDLLAQMTKLRLNDILPRIEKEACVRSFVDCFKSIIDKIADTKNESETEN
jgi:Fe-S-cluster containining protein